MPAAHLRLSERNFRIAPALVVLAWIAGFMVALFREEILPSKFFNDARWIESIARGQGSDDQSFAVVAWIYRSLGLIGHETLAGIIQYALASLLIMTIVFRTSKTSSNANSLCAAVALMLSSVYLGGFSKDVFVLPIAYLACLTSRRRASTLVLILTIIAYAAMFRTYWWGVLAFFIAVNLVFRRGGVTFSKWALTLIVSSSFASLAIEMTQGVPSSTYRETINGGRYDSPDASTMISPPLNLPEPFASLLNPPIICLFLLVPIPLISMGEVYYLVAAGSILLLWGTLLSRLWHESIPETDVERIRGLALLTAFVAVQAVFEPDYGSALRHLTPLLPVLLMVSASSPSPMDSDGVQTSSRSACGAGGSSRPLLAPSSTGDSIRRSK